MLQENEHCEKEEEISKQVTNAGFWQQSEKSLDYPILTYLLPCYVVK